MDRRPVTGGDGAGSAPARRKATQRSWLSSGSRPHLSGQELSRTVASGSSATPPRFMEANLLSSLTRLFVVVGTPAAALAAGMHYSPEIREQVESRFPGATKTLSQITNVDYDQKSTESASSDGMTKQDDTSKNPADGTPDDTTKSTLPPHFETVPETLDRIRAEKGVDKDGKASGDKNGDQTKMSQSTGTSTHGTTAKPEASDKPLQNEKTASTMSPSVGAGSETTKEFEAKGTEGKGKSSDWPNVTVAVASGATKEADIAVPTVPKTSKPVPVTKPAEKTVKSAGTTVATGVEPPRSIETSANDGSDAKSASSDGDAYGEKIWRVLGRGKFDPAVRTSKHTVDDRSVYEMPGFMIRSKNRQASPAAEVKSPELPSTKAPAPKPFSKKAPSVDPPPVPEPSIKAPIPKPPPQATAPELPTVETLSAAERELSALKAELASQAKWDAVRLQEAVQAQSVADKKAAAAQTAELVRKHKLELDSMREEISAQLQKTIAEKTKELETKMEKERDEQVQKLLSAREKELRQSLDSEYASLQKRFAEDRRAELAALKSSVSSLYDSLVHCHDYQKTTKEAGEIASSAFAMGDAVSSRHGFFDELTGATRGNELGTLVASSIPPALTKQGVYTVDQLRDSFKRVAMEGRKAALLPEGDTGNLWGHLLASVFARLKVTIDYGISSDAIAQLKTNEERIRMAEKCVASGDIVRAVESLDGLRSLPAEIVADWLDLAKARIAAEQGVRVLVADAIITQHCLAGKCSKRAAK